MQNQPTTPNEKINLEKHLENCHVIICTLTNTVHNWAFIYADSDRAKDKLAELELGSNFAVRPLKEYMHQN